MVVVQQAGVDLSLGAERLKRRFDGHGRGGAGLHKPIGLQVVVVVNNLGQFRARTPRRPIAGT